MFVVRRRPLVAVVDFSSKEGRQAMVNVRNKLGSPLLMSCVQQKVRLSYFNLVHKHNLT